MIYSSQFIFVHMPKTGGTFVTDCMKKLNHSGKLTQLSSFALKRWYCRDRFYKVRGVLKHGCVSEIPQEYQGLPIVGCIRSPEAWYSSNYRFAWWRRHPERYLGVEAHPSFPDLSFRDYLSLSSSIWISSDLPDLVPPYPAGRYTLLLIKWFSPDPRKFLKRVNGPIKCEHLVDEIGNILWLNCSSLNNDLYRLLREFKWPDEKIDFIRGRSAVLPSLDPRNHGAEIRHDLVEEDVAVIKNMDSAAYQFIEYLNQRKEKHESRSSK